jgi:diguanylate cyclase (GGDEF)-like protein
MSLRSPNFLVMFVLAIFTAVVASAAQQPVGASALAGALPGALAFALMVASCILLADQFLRRGGSRFLGLAMTELCCATLAAGAAAGRGQWAWAWVAWQVLLPAGLALSLWGGPERLRAALALPGLRRHAAAGLGASVALAAGLLAAIVLLPHRIDPANLGGTVAFGVGAAAVAGFATVMKRARRGDIERWIVISAAVSVSSTILGLIAVERGTVAWWASRSEAVLAAFALLAALWGEYHRLYRKLAVAAGRLDGDAMIDPVTRTLTRDAILEQGLALLPGVGRDRAPLTVAVVELDDFPVLLARHGNVTGDRILAEVGRRITAALREYDAVGRLGQSSFLLLLPDADVSGGRMALERVVANVRDRPIATLRSSVPTRVSVGVAEAEPGRADLDTVIERAYRALGTARAQGSEHVFSRAEDAASAGGWASSSAPPGPERRSPRPPSEEREPHAA